MAAETQDERRSTAAAAPAPQRVARPGVALAVVAAIACTAQFMVVLDSTIVNVALPSMKSGLGLSTSAQEWVVNGYLITFGGVLLLAARASDLFGRRRVFQFGLALFTIASLAGGLAQHGWMLLAARAVQGVGAAALAPSSLSLITASHTERGRRTRAMTWWGVAAATAGAAGIVLGGLLTEALSWRWVMLVNVPIGGALLAASLCWLQSAGAVTDRPRVDIHGAWTITGSVAAIVYAVSVAPAHGWASGPVVAGLAVGAVLAASFVAVERRTGAPLVPAEVVMVHNVRVGNVLTLVFGAVMTAPLFILSLYLQEVLGKSALDTGLALLPMVAVISVGVLASQRLLPIVGPRRLVLGGGLLTAVGLLWLAQLPTYDSYLPHVLCPTLIVGAGTSVMMMPVVVAATAGVDPRNAGVASGLINMCRQLGAAVGLAVLITIATTVTRHSTATGDTATVQGYRAALVVVAALSVLTAVLSRLLAQPGESA